MSESGVGNPPASSKSTRHRESSESLRARTDPADPRINNECHVINSPH